MSEFKLVPPALTAENGAKAALIGEFHEMADGACVAVSWTTIKAIWKKALEVVAVPQLEQLSFQTRVGDWMQRCFGQAISADRTERNHRFLEESLELVQSMGCTQSEAHQLVDYVFSRPVGEPFQEVGGVRVTLAALCNAADIDEDDAAETELARVLRPEMIEKIRAKQAGKPKHSPLPEHPAFQYSTDYDALWNFICAGHEALAFVDYRFMDEPKDYKPWRDAAKVARRGPYQINIGARGISYASAHEFDATRWPDEKELFIKICKNINLEWASPQQSAPRPEAGQHKPKCLKCSDTGCYPLGSSVLCDHRVNSLVQPEQAQQSDNDVLGAALDNLVHDNYERSQCGSRNRKADANLIRAALAHRQQPRPVPTSEWKTIETAPENVAVLVHYAKYITDSHPGWEWTDEQSRTRVAKLIGEIWYEEFGLHDCPVIKPTHWMLIPEPPTGLVRPADPEVEKT